MLVIGDWCVTVSVCHAPRNNHQFYASSSIGRAAVSKAAGWGFDSLLACAVGGLPLSLWSCRRRKQGLLPDLADQSVLSWRT